MAFPRVSAMGGKRARANLPSSRNSFSALASGSAHYLLLPVVQFLLVHSLIALTRANVPT